MAYPTREQQRAACRDHYARNKHRYLARSKHRNRRVRTQVVAAIRRAKEGVPCTDCGGSFPVVCMDFDHRPGAAKHANIADASRFHSEAHVLAEIAKCDLVCANCHRIRTFAREPEAGTAEIPPAGLLPFPAEGSG